MNYDTSSRFDSKHFKEILKTYEDSIKTNSSVYLDADEFVDIADYYNEQDCSEKAEEVISIAYKQHPNDTDILIFIARTYAMKGQIDQAYKYLNRITDQSDREVFFLKLDLLSSQEKWEEANDVAKEIAKREKYAFETLIDLVDAFTDQDKQEYANVWLNELKERYGEVCREDDRMMETLSNYYYVFKEPEKSLAFFKKLIDKHPYSIEYWVGQAQCYTRMYQIALAEESIDYALAINDENPVVLELKGGCRMELGDLNSAYDYFKRFEQFTANKVNAWNFLRHITLQLGLYKETIKYCKQIIKSPYANHEYKAVANSDAALSLAYEEKPNEGLKYASKAIELVPNEPDFLSVRGFIYLKLKDFENAKLDFKKAEGLLTMKPNKEFNCLMLIGSYHFDENLYESAIYYFEKAEEKYPESGPACYVYLAYCWFAIKDPTMFLHYLAKIREYIPDIYTQLGGSDNPIDDPEFNNAINKVKRDIANNKLNISDYLIT